MEHMELISANPSNITNQLLPEPASPPEPKRKTCTKCGESFIPPSGNPKKAFCGRFCRYTDLAKRMSGIDRKKRFPKPCAVCGETFYVQKHLLTQQITCGTKCGGAYRRHRETRNCKLCNSEFIVPVSSKISCCSKKCGRDLRKGSNHARWVEPATRPCLHCGEQFDGTKAWKKSKKFCTMECAKQHLEEHGEGGRYVPIGTVSTYSDGYRYIKLGNKLWVPEHRFVAETTLGRKLRRYELVHHKNGDYGDNRPDNLQVMTMAEHMKIHHEAERIGLLVQAGELIVVPRGEWVHPIEGMVC